MPRLTAKDFPQELLDYYDYYAHGKITKREFLNLAETELCPGNAGRIYRSRYSGRIHYLSIA